MSICDDPKCPLNRMGMRHEIHDENKETEELKQEISPKQPNDEFHGSASDALQELSRQVNKEKPNKLSREQILEERRKREKQSTEQEAQEKVKLSREQILEERRKREKQSIEQESQEKVKHKESPKQKISIKSKILSHFNSSLPSIDQILHSRDPYETFNIDQESTCDDIKSKYKELSKNYNAIKGSANRSSEEQELLTKTQSKINIAYDFLRKKHCG